ncbi:MAG: hypothetical protein EBR07_11100 [Planctomycetes bacterium]|nr:hypothetical protein [Planctomycetota bacterium]
MDNQSVILAVASPPGSATRGIVRASGADACQVLCNAMDSNCHGSAAVRERRRGVHVVRLRDPSVSALVLVMPGPASATGEDCAEIHTVGNPFVLERIIAALGRGSTACSPRRIQRACGFVGAHADCIRRARRRSNHG